ncbi:redoxin domain-containing protein [Micromonospora sp. NPDC048999]|uniref:TlpA family protein disulfide reductase n=1 Tax=Micromonospora sp. NPDC048999 TaxID=3155391 RepID=UPI0033E3C922
MRSRSCLPALLVVALALGGCTGSTGEVVDRPPSAALPGPVPKGVTFVAPPTNAPRAPGFTLELLDGTVLDMTEQWDRRPVVLVFLEPWCTLCAEQQREINQLVEDYRDVILFVGVGADSTADRMRQYVRDNEVKHPVGIDATGQIWRKYRVEEPPLVALVTKGGKLLRGWPGGTDTLRAQLNDLVTR